MRSTHHLMLKYFKKHIQRKYLNLQKTDRGVISYYMCGYVHIKKNNKKQLSDL